MSNKKLLTELSELIEKFNNSQYVEYDPYLKDCDIYEFIKEMKFYINIDTTTKSIYGKILIVDKTKVFNIIDLIEEDLDDGKDEDNSITTRINSAKFNLSELLLSSRFIEFDDHLYKLLPNGDVNIILKNESSEEEGYVEIPTI